MTIYDRNIASICGRFPAFKEDILDRHTPAKEIEVLETPSGYPTAKTGGVLLHSHHDPPREARRLASGSVTGNDDCIVVEGFGLGYTVEALLEEAPGVPLVILEPDPSLFLAILSVRPVDHIFARGNVSLFIAIEPTVFTAILSKAGYASVKVVRHRALSGLYGDYFDRMEEALSSYIARKDVNMNTLKRFGRVWVRNLVRNLPVMASSGGTEQLTGRFQGIPALILAAGPSVEEVIPHIPELRRKFVITAVDTSARLLSSIGIDPDFLVVVDPQYWNSRHLDGVNFRRTVLISESSTHPRVFRMLELPVLFGGSIFPLGRFLEGHTNIRGKLGAGGSVATSAWDIMRRAGCSELFCAGLDLGFPDMRTHFRGCLFDTLSLSGSHRTRPSEGSSFHALRDASPFPEENYEGGRTLTDRRLIIYKWWFEHQCAEHPETATSSLSSRSVRVRGMGHTGIENLLAYPDRRSEIDGGLSAFFSPPAENSGIKTRLLEGVNELISALSTLENLAQDALSALHGAREGHSRGGDISRELGRLDSIDARILSSASREIVGFLMQDVIRDISGNDNEGKGKDPLETSEEIYRRLLESSAYHRELLREAHRYFRR